jgi:hypothetical protein
MEECTRAIEQAISNGVMPRHIINKVAALSCFNKCPRIVALSLSFIGRETQFNGITISQCNAAELVYVDTKWVPGKLFYSICAPGWAHRFEFFIRSIGSPIIVSRHGASRDKRLIAEALRKEHIMATPLTAGCSSFAANRAFPQNIDEIPSFLNVLKITPARIIAAAK